MYRSISNTAPAFQFVHKWVHLLNSFCSWTAQWNNQHRLSLPVTQMHKSLCKITSRVAHALPLNFFKIVWRIIILHLQNVCLAQPMLAESMLNREVGTDDLERSLPTSPILRIPDPFFYIQLHILHILPLQLRFKKKVKYLSNNTLRHLISGKQH